MKAIISARFLASPDARPTAKPFEVWDRSLRGFILRVQPSGARSYVVQIGRGRRITIGPVGHLTPSEARERAEKVLGNLAHGLPPLAGLDPDEKLSLKPVACLSFRRWSRLDRAPLQSCRPTN